MLVDCVTSLALSFSDKLPMPSVLIFIRTLLNNTTWILNWNVGGVGVRSCLSPVTRYFIFLLDSLVCLFAHFILLVIKTINKITIHHNITIDYLYCLRY